MTPQHTVTDIDVCVFDAYGTLFDYASAAQRCKDALGADWQRLSDTWRRKQLEYTWLRSLMGRHADFWHVTGEGLDYALASIKRDDPALRAKLMQQYLMLDAFPEVPRVLERLKKAEIRTAVLSNGNPSMLTAALNSSGIMRLIDASLSVESTGIFKPHPSVYQLVVDRFETPSNRVCFFSSNGWDACGAAAFGFRAVWVNRYDMPPERLPVGPEVTLRTLDEVPALLGLT